MYQISSGLNSPEECERAVVLLFEHIKKNIDENCELIYRKNDKHKNDKYAKSIIFDSDKDLSDMIGTIQWIADSNRPGVKRKNWFIDFSKVPEIEIIDKALEKDITFKTTHSSGPGGQNVNKVESAVYATHIPTGITVFSSKERDQLKNKRECINKIASIIQTMNMDNKANQKNDMWQAHNNLIRGNPVKIFISYNFKEKK